MGTNHRLRALEGEVWALMDYLGVKSVLYRAHRTGNPDEPFTYEKKMVKIGVLEKEKSGNHGGKK